MRVLIIEDEPLSQEYLSMLILENYSQFEIVALLNSVKGAIDWFSKNSADLIFMDFILIDGDSSEILDKIEIKSPIVFISALLNIEAIVGESKNYYFLYKPFEENKLKSIIDSILRKSFNTNFMLN